MSNLATAGSGPRLKAPGRSLAGYVEWRAGRVSDPVQRLAYLRTSAAFWGSRPIRRAIADARLHRLSAFVAFALLLPVPMITDGAAPRRSVQAASKADTFATVWTVENTPDHELYSNGLRIEKRFLASPEGRRNFQRWRIDTGAREESAGPYGIVFHTTESDAAVYDESNNRNLRRAAEGTVGFVKSQRAYHFVIDRFGRVFRTVPENEPANHAGASVWADEKYFFVNINHSFLGVSFDGQTRGAGGESTITEPQIASARLLTEILRSRYRIPAANCVTHAQVSVSVSNMGIGYHTDWAAGFPFARLGLPVNYLIPLPAITLFGFAFEDYYSNLAADELQDGISAGETILRQDAARKGLSTAAYRRLLAKRFRAIVDPHRYIPAPGPELRSSNP